MPTKLNAHHLVEVAMVAAITALALSRGVAQVTAPGEDMPVSLRRPFETAMFSDLNTGYVYSLGNRTVIIATADGGVTWRLVRDTIAARGDKDSTAVFFLDTNIFWIVYKDGTLERTNDGGRSFVSATAQALNSLGRPLLEPHGHPRGLVGGGLFLQSASAGWLACGDLLLHTLDGGASWQWTKVPGGMNYVFNPWFFDDNEGMAVGDGVARTTDGGQTWQAVPDTPTNLDELSCTRSGFCVAGALQYGPLFATSDRGRTWTNLNVPLKPGREDELRGFQAFATNLVIAVGSDNGFTTQDLERASAMGTSLPNAVQGLILKWDGSDWMRLTQIQPATFAGVWFIDANNGWLPGYENTIYKTTDGGQTLQFVPDYFRQIAALTPSPTPFVFPTPVATPTP